MTTEDGFAKQQEEGQTSTDDRMDLESETQPSSGKKEPSEYSFEKGVRDPKLTALRKKYFSLKWTLFFLFYILYLLGGGYMFRYLERPADCSRDFEEELNRIKLVKDIFHIKSSLHNESAGLETEFIDVLGKLDEFLSRSKNVGLFEMPKFAVVESKTTQKRPNEERSRDNMIENQTRSNEEREGQQNLIEKMGSDDDENKILKFEEFFENFDTDSDSTEEIEEKWLKEDCGEWSVYEGTFFSFTAVTTIGYGHIYPESQWGRALCVVYSFIGVPINLLLITKMSSYFSKFIIEKTKKRYVTEDGMMRSFIMLLDMLLLTVPGILVFLILPSFVFWVIEGNLSYTQSTPWTYVDSFYFSFISLATIGFGDLVAGRDIDDAKDWKPLYESLTMIYLFVGLGFIVTVFNVVTEFLKLPAKLAAFRARKDKLKLAFKMADIKRMARLRKHEKLEEGHVTPDLNAVRYIPNGEILIGNVGDEDSFMTLDDRVMQAVHSEVEPASTSLNENGQVCSTAEASEDREEEETLDEIDHRDPNHDTITALKSFGQQKRARIPGEFIDPSYDERPDGATSASPRPPSSAASAGGGGRRFQVSSADYTSSDNESVVSEAAVYKQRKIAEGPLRKSASVAHPSNYFVDSGNRPTKAKASSSASMPTERSKLRGVSMPQMNGGRDSVATSFNASEARLQLQDLIEAVSDLGTSLEDILIGHGDEISVFDDGLKEDKQLDRMRKKSRQISRSEGIDFLEDDDPLFNSGSTSGRNSSARKPSTVEEGQDVEDGASNFPRKTSTRRSSLGDLKNWTSKVSLDFKSNFNKMFANSADQSFQEVDENEDKNKKVLKRGFTVPEIVVSNFEEDNQEESKEDSSEKQ